MYFKAILFDDRVFEGETNNVIKTLKKYKEKSSPLKKIIFSEEELNEEQSLKEMTQKEVLSFWRSLKE